MLIKIPEILDFLCKTGLRSREMKSTGVKNQILFDFLYKIMLPITPFSSMRKAHPVTSDFTGQGLSFCFLSFICCFLFVYSADFI